MSSRLTRQLQLLQGLAKRLVAMDDPNNPEGVADRRQVTLSNLIEQAKVALEADGIGSRLRTKQEWADAYNSGQVLAGRLTDVLKVGRHYPYERTHVLRLDRAAYGFDTLSFDPNDLEPDDG